MWRSPGIIPTQDKEDDLSITPLLLLQVPTSPTRPVKKLQFDRSIASDEEVFGLVTPDDLGKV